MVYVVAQFFTLFAMLNILPLFKPFSWSWGQAKPTMNEWSWTNLSSILYVEQPVGTGFSQGEPDIENEDDLAAELVGFFQQFLEVFTELKGKNLYLTGESVSRILPDRLSSSNPKMCAVRGNVCALHCQLHLRESGRVGFRIERHLDCGSYVLFQHYTKCAC